MRRFHGALGSLGGDLIRHQLHRENFMFRCYFCNQITPPKTTRHGVVIEVREKHYSARRKEFKGRGFRSRDDDVQDRGGRGKEIIREVDACPECASKHQEPTVIVEEPIVAAEPNVQSEPNVEGESNVETEPNVEPNADSQAAQSKPAETKTAETTPTE